MVRGICSLFIAALMLAASLVPITTAQPTRRDVVIGMIQEPDILNSIVTSTAASNFVLKAMMNYATYYDPSWAIRPNIVESIPNLDDGSWRMLAGGKMRLLWKLRRGVKWSDGKEVTAADFAFTSELVKDPDVGATSTFNCGFGDKVERVEALDTYTVAVTWRQVYPFANTCINDGGLVPKHVLEGAYKADPAKFKETAYGREPATTISNGPYVLKSWTRGSEIVMEANPQYWRGRPVLDRVTFKIFSDANTMLANLVSGSVDVLPSGFVGLSFGQALQVQDLIRQNRAPNIKLDFGPSLLYDSLTINLDNPILKDKRVRQALAYASDRVSISKSLYQGIQVVTDSPVPPNHAAFFKGIKKYPFDLNRARALLEEAGWRAGPDGIRRNAQGEKLSVVVTTTAGNRDRERVQQLLQDWWRQAGIELVIENFPSRVVFGTMVYQRRFKGIILQSNGFERPEIRLDAYTSAMVKPVGEFSINFLGYKNNDVDKIAVTYSGELDRNKRTDLLGQFQKIWAEELPEIPLYWFSAATAYNVNLKNYQPVGLAAYPEPATWNIYQWRWGP
jgi:peptide/nickel transport system substrate-binding protein